MNRFVAFAVVLGLVTGCASPDPFGGRNYLNCRSAAEIESLPTLRVKVEKIQPCGVILGTDDGKSLSLAGPCGGEPVVERFMRTLEHGRTYTFPSAFLEFKKREAEPIGIGPPLARGPSLTTVRRDRLYGGSADVQDSGE